MSPRRLLHALVALLAVLGLSALPAASASSVPAPVSAPAFEDGEFIDEAELTEDPFEFDEEVEDESEDEFSDEDFCDLLDEDLDEVLGDDEEITDEGDFDFGDEEDFELRQVGDEEDLLDPEDEELEDELGDDELDEELSDEELAELCATLEDSGTVLDEVSETDVTKIKKKGILTAEMYASGKGVLDSTLTLGGATARAAAAKPLGRSHQKVAKAGLVKIKIKLTKRGRKVLRKATRTLHLTLGTKLVLASGKTVKRTKTITVKPKKNKKPKKG